VGGTSILRRRDALRLSRDNGVDGCESSHDADPPVRPPRRATPRLEVRPSSPSPSRFRVPVAIAERLSYVIIVINNFKAANNAEDKKRCVITRSHVSSGHIIRYFIAR
jgi:hypothetical protein